MFSINLATSIIRFITLIPALTLHELSHAVVADRFGDDTPRRAGRLTLNPLAHLDVMGSLMLLVAGFGWAKPVPINPYALYRRSRWAVMWVSLAGPLSNLALAILAIIPLRLGWVPVEMQTNAILPTPFTFLVQFMLINLMLAFFNLIPVSPLDGEKVLEPFLPPSALSTLDRIRPYGPLILMAIVFILPAIGIDIFGWIMTPLMRLFLFIAVG
ncbi:MAG: site-2 protease family protein [Anaerolineae bacterium]|nr:site-2 protease family protein [Anaerolineae bacterium]